jgi:hypothetical protein
VDVAELVQLVETGEHFGGVESRVLLLEDARVVEQGSEVSTGDIFLLHNEPRPRRLFTLTGY